MSIHKGSECDKEKLYVREYNNLKIYRKCSRTSKYADAQVQPFKMACAHSPIHYKSFLVVNNT